MTTEGQILLRTDPTAGTATLPSARFTIWFGTQEVLDDNSVDIVWDQANANDWDDIGFPSDYSTTGNFVFPAGSDGEYLVVAYYQLEAESPGSFTNRGQTLIVIAQSSDLANEEQSAPCNIDIGPKVSVSGVHKFWANSELQIEAHLFDAGTNAIVNAASVSITKLRAIPPLP